MHDQNYHPSPLSHRALLLAVALLVTRPLHAEERPLRGQFTLKTTSSVRAEIGPKSYKRKFRPRMQVTIADSPNGNVAVTTVVKGRACRMTGTRVTPAFITLTPGQKCEQDLRLKGGGRASLKGRLDSGSVVLDGGTLTLKTKWTVTGTAKVLFWDLDVHGTISTRGASQ